MTNEMNITRDILKEDFSLKDCEAILYTMASRICNAKASPAQEPVSAYFKDGEFAGVRVCLGGDDFLIYPHDCEWGEKNWEDTMAALKEKGLTTWNYRQICLTMAYREDIGRILKENGGDPLDEWYWTSAEYSACGAFIYHGYTGSLAHDVKNITYSCRPALALNKDYKIISK